MKPARLWPLAIGAVLAASVAANALLFWVARDRNAAAVEPDYYRRAVRWDSTMAEERAAAALGWRLEAALGAPRPEGTELTVRAADRAGAPLEGLAVEVAAVHNLDPLHPVTARLLARGGGVYGARLPLRHAGLWELRLAAARGADRLHVVLRRDTGGAARP